MGKRRVISLLLTVSLIAVPVVGFWQRQNLYDWYKLKDYDPPAVVANLAAADTMSGHAKRIFYVNQPELISDTPTFQKECSSTEQTIVLGCYHPLQQGIFIYEVKDARLGGIQEVTAAHEMLHAAYDRLSSDEKARVNNMIEDFYKNELKDPRILQTIEEYKKTEPNELVNEMHSIFGTEIANLPTELEDYYKRYFYDRSTVVGYSQKYESEFTSRTERAKQYETQLESLKQSIEAQEANLRSQLDKINAEQKRLDSLSESNQIEAYNAGVAGYNTMVDTYNAGIASYRRDVSRYNSILEQYNAIAGELGQLYNAIDTRLETKTAQ